MRYGLDIETGENEHGRYLTTVQTYSKERGTAFYNIKNSHERHAALGILRDKDNEFVAFEAQTEQYYIAKGLGIWPKIVGDGYIAALMLQERETSLDALSKKYLGKGKKGDIGELTNGSFSFDKEEYSEADKAYAVEDAVLALELEEVLRAKLQNGMERVYTLECGLIPVLVGMRVRGLRVDKERLKIEQESLRRKLEVEKRWLFEEVGEGFKLGTRKLAPYFEKLGIPLPTLRTAKGGQVSFSAEALNQLPEFEFITRLIEARHLEDVISSEKDLFDNIDGDRLRPEFRPLNYSGSARIYTTRPSVNSLPEELRRSIVPSSGCKFWDIDWIGAELIYLAHQASEEELIEYYEQGGDIHKLVASKLLGVEVDDITEEQREISKIVSFSIVFGSEGHAASRAAKVSITEAREWVAKFYETFPKIKNFMDVAVRVAEKTGRCKTWLGRTRVLYKIWSKDSQEVEEGKRQAQNTPVQNGVADLQKWAMVRITKSLPEAKLVFTVFDSFLLEVGEELKIEDFQERLEEIFTFTHKGKTVKFRFKIKECSSWGS